MVKAAVFIYLTVTVLCITAALAAPPFASTSTTQIQSYGVYSIRAPSLYYEELSNPFKLHFHVYNSTSGQVITNTTANCTLHIYNNTNSHVVVYSPLAFDAAKNEYEASPLVLNQTGTHIYIVHCLNALGWGGFATGEFEVTRSGNAENYTDLTPVAVFILLPALLAALLIASAFLFRDDEEHKAYRIGLYLLSVVFMLFSLVIFMFSASAFYAVTELSSVASILMWTFAILAGVVFAYWFLYIIVWVLNYVRRKRNGEE